VPQNTGEAIQWYRKAAEQNQPDAAAALGDIYFLGQNGIKASGLEAFKWYRIGAAQNNADCLNGLGFLYERGLGVPKNPAKAAAYYQQAAERGYIRAYANLGQLYVDGLNLKEDLVEAYKWFTVGANEGDGVARHYLMEMDLNDTLSASQKAEALRRVQEYQIQQKKADRQNQRNKS
jgi:TPR repeat protein